MNHRTHTANGKTYVEIISAKNPVKTEADALDLVALCGENETSLLLIHHDALDADFFDLKTRSAGLMLQKFANYHIKAVVVLPEDIVQSKRFMEMALEANKGNSFRIYASREEAQAWLVR